MERISRLRGQIAACPGCGRQPMYVQNKIRGGQHWLECPPCGTRTSRFGTLNEAVESWERAETKHHGVAA